MRLKVQTFGNVHRLQKFNLSVRMNRITFDDIKTFKRFSKYSWIQMNSFLYEKIHMHSSLFSQWCFRRKGSSGGGVKTYALIYRCQSVSTISHTKINDMRVSWKIYPNTFVWIKIQKTKENFEGNLPLVENVTRAIGFCPGMAWVKLG